MRQYKKDLIEEFIRIIDEIDLDQIGMKNQIEKEVERYKKFRTGVLGVKSEMNYFYALARLCLIDIGDAS